MQRGVRMPLSQLTFDCLELSSWFFEPVWNMLPSSGKLLRNSNLLFKRRYLEKTLFYPTNTYSSLCISECTCPEVLFSVEFLCEGWLYTQNILGSVRQVYMPYAHMQANVAVGEQQDCSNSVYKLVWDLKSGPLDCVWSARHTEPNSIYVLDRWKFSNEL